VFLLISCEKNSPLCDLLFPSRFLITIKEHKKETIISFSRAGHAVCYITHRYEVLSSEVGVL
jgi:hypothetical protein